MNGLARAMRTMNGQAHEWDEMRGSKGIDFNFTIQTEYITLSRKNAESRHQVTRDKDVLRYVND